MTSTPIADTHSAALPTSLVTPPLAQRTQRTLKTCPNSLLIQERCSHNNYQWLRVPCKRWVCEPCANTRLWKELYPEIGFAYKDAYLRGWTLKFVTLTWQGDDTGALPGPAGTKRRRLDIQHLKQSLKRDGTYYESMRVAEYHQKGTVHVHMLAVSPYIPQAILSKKWARHARGAVIVHIEAVGFKCPRCWDSHEKDPRIRRKRILVLNPGEERASCPTCSFSVSADVATEGTLKAALWETAKYVTKSPIGRPTRSKGWQVYHREALRLLKSKESSKKCTTCLEPHTFIWWPESAAYDVYPDDSIEIAIGGAGYHQSATDCHCFDWETDVLKYRQLYGNLTEP